MNRIQTHSKTNACAILARVLAAVVVVQAFDDFQANADQTTPANEDPAQFELKWDGGAITSLRRSHDRFDTDYVQEKGRLGDVVVRYRQGGAAWQTGSTAELAAAEHFDVTEPENGKEVAANYRFPAEGTAVLQLAIHFIVESDAIHWTVELKNHSNAPLEIGDLAIPLPINSDFRRGRPATAAVLKHSFISGHGSFLFWMRPNSVGPYLTMTPRDDTSLEYWDAIPKGNRRREFRVYVHSAAAGEDAKSHGTNWRQPHTRLTLAPAGTAGDSHSYGFKLQWDDDYDGVRQTLVDEGLVDVQVVPGMTVPSDLSAQIALRSNEPIDAVEAEFPDDTTIETLGRNGEYQLYRVTFARLGENRLTVRFGGGRHMFLEFFATEPLETLIKKRAAFLARSQHHDPTKWYHGLISDRNLETGVLTGPDNYDRISGFRIYAVTCDDPGLCKPAFLAAKNAEYPVQKEITALDDYVEHFVWGGLQRTTDEEYAYGIYGIQDWQRNRTSDDPGRDGQSHPWRVYDYPHIMLMYFSMYRIASEFPQIETRLTAEEYLQRAYGTALAMYTVPMAIEKWSACRTGFYNELVLVDLIAMLEAQGMHAEAETLRGHWEKKVKYFASGRADLFESEYPFDSTGFESTHALSKYAIEHAEESDGGKFGVTSAEAHRFMETQIAANLFCRGSIEPAYYYLGSDYRGSAGNSYTLSYMSQMGGWAVLDYALYFAADPSAMLRLGYASILSSWALVNSGTAESNYGYWYPGEQHDGGAGGGFEPAPYGETWLGQPHHRGSWYYACEIDLGFSGALRAAATVLADDPIFGRICYGGDWSETPNGDIAVVPKDGLRRRFHAIVAGRKLHLTLESDRFSAGEPLIVTNDLTQMRFCLESANPARHQAEMTISGLPTGRYQIRNGDQKVSTIEMRDGQSAAVQIPVPAGGQSQQVVVAAEAPNYPAPQSGDFTIRDFHFASGETLPQLRMHYLTLGTPDRDVQGKIRNAVMILHGTTGSSAQFLRPEFATEMFGPGQPLDASRYFIIIPDNLGHGQSSKPSDGLRARFPRYGYTDMISAQQRLLVEGLDVNHLRLIIGTSMGGMHCWLWGQMHPDFMDALVPLASVPDQIAGRNRVWRRTISDAVRNDPSWNSGDYQAQPRSLRTAVELLYFMSSNPVVRLQEGPTRKAADDALDQYLADRMKDYDANDVVYAVEASGDYDPAPGLERIKAPLLAINFADDLINPPELGVLEREIGRVPHGQAVVIPLSKDSVGHGTHTKAAVWKSLLVDFLNEGQSAK